MFSIPDSTPWQVGRIFNVRLESGMTELECIHWDSERRVFKATDNSGLLDLTWDEFDDQLALGRVDLVGLPE